MKKPPQNRDGFNLPIKKTYHFLITLLILIPPSSALILRI